MKIKRVLIGIVAIGLIGIGAATWSRGLGANGPDRSAKPVPAPPLTAKGTIVPKKQTKLAFKIGGRIALLGVELGDHVEQGSVVARLESDDLELAVRAAADAVAIQQALVDQLLAGSRPEELAAAQAAYDGATAKYEELLGGVSDADVKAGEQGVAAAQAEVARAHSALARLNAGLDPYAVQLAGQEVERAKGALWAAQIERDGIKGFKANPEFMGAAADARVMAAEIAVREAQTKLEQAQAAVPQPEELSAAEQAVRSAIASLDSAQARLAQLQAGAKGSELAAARAAANSAKAQLELKRNGAAPVDFAVAKARLHQAETQLAQANQALAGLDLRAPHAGTVTQLGAHAGKYIASGAMVLTVADLTALRVETTIWTSTARRSLYLAWTLP